MEKKDKLRYQSLLSVVLGVILMAESIKNLQIGNLHIIYVIVNVLILNIGLYLVILCGTLIERQKNELKKINIEIK